MMSRRVPVRIDDDLMDLGIQDRRLAVDLADHSGMAGNDAVAFHRLDLRGGNVHHYVAVAEEAGHGAQAHQIGLELAEPDLSGDVHRRIADTAGDAVRRQSVAGLEPFQRRIDIGIEGGRYAGTFGEVAGYHEPPAQQLHVGIDDAELKLLGGGNLRPATPADDVGILVQRLLDMRHGLGAEHRRGRNHPARLRRRTRVKLVVPVATLGGRQNVLDSALRRG
jgi:hypothetical protein